MTRGTWWCGLALAAALAGCGGDAEEGATFQEAVDSAAVANTQLADVSNENALGALQRALMQSMERAELLAERTQSDPLRALARALREERAALTIAVSEAATQAGVQLDPPADSLSAMTAGQELRQEHEEALSRLRGMEPGAFDTAFVTAAARASEEAAERVRYFDAAAIAPVVLEQVRAVATSLAREAEALRAASGTADTTAGAAGATGA